MPTFRLRLCLTVVAATLAAVVAVADTGTTYPAGTAVEVSTPCCSVESLGRVAASNVT